LLINRSSPCVEVCSGATVSILRPSIDHRTAPGIAGQDHADAESMIRATPQCARFIEKRGNLALGDACG
jgi:4-hydroxy-L-threonine phosphate dehydrogenase PdxA